MMRNKSIDCLKFFLIIFVIIGHFIEPSRYCNSISTVLYSLVYSFHMPLFVFLSGYFYRYRNVKEEFGKCFPLIETFLVAHIGCCIVSRDFSWHNFLNPGLNPSWYLFGLICWRLFSSAMFAKYSFKEVFLAALVVEILLFILLPESMVLCLLMKTISFYPYYLLGIYFRGGKNQSRQTIPFVLLGVISFAVTIATSSRLQHVVFFQRDGIMGLMPLSDRPVVLMFAYRYFLLLVTICNSASVFRLFFNRINNGIVAKCGQKTLFIYLIHAISYPLIWQYLHGLKIQLIGAAIFVVLVTYMSTFVFSTFIMNPCSKVYLVIAKRSGT